MWTVTFMDAIETWIERAFVRLSNVTDTIPRKKCPTCRSFLESRWIDWTRLIDAVNRPRKTAIGLSIGHRHDNAAPFQFDSAAFIIHHFNCCLIQRPPASIHQRMSTFKQHMARFGALI